MTTQTSPHNPAPLHTLHVYLCATGYREGSIHLSPEEYERSTRRMREAERGPEFFDQVTDQKTGKRYDLYREKCGGGCWCAVRAKPAKAVLVCMEPFINNSTGLVLFTSRDKSLQTRARHDEYTRLLLGGKPRTYVYLMLRGKSYEILGEVEDPRWEDFHPTHATKPNLAVA